MMRFKELIRLLVISLVMTTWACDPVEVPEPKDEDPPFWSEIELDDTDHEWASGKSNIFNFSDYEAVRGDGIRYSSILRPDSCNSPCPSSFRVDLYGPDRWMTGQMVDPALQFRPAARAWFRENEKVAGYTINGNIMPVDSPTTTIERVVWSLNGEVVARDKEEYNGVLIDTMKRYNLCVEVEAENGIEQRICHSAENFHAKPLKVQLIGTPSGRAVKLVANASLGGGEPYTYFWNGERTNSRMKEYESVHDTMSIELKVVDKNGTYVIIKNTIHFGNPRIFPINAGLNVRTKSSETFAPLFNKASVRWVDREGKEYSTAYGEQPNWASFEVESFAPFQSSATGEHMAKVGLAFKGVLYSENNNKREVRSGRATMLFRYPN